MKQTTDAGVDQVTPGQTAEVAQWRCANTGQRFWYEVEPGAGENTPNNCPSCGRCYPQEVGDEYRYIENVQD